jgi:hypothetical protein
MAPYKEFIFDLFIFDQIKDQGSNTASWVGGSQEQPCQGYGCFYSEVWCLTRQYTNASEWFGVSGAKEARVTD